MCSDDLSKFEQVLPSELMANAISLESIGVNEYAWRWLDAISVIEILIANKILILGGDVYSYLDGKIKITGDSWYIKVADYTSAEDLLKESQNKSVNYIKSYTQRNGENYCYSIVIR